MSLIEQATKRLEELRRAGADIPDSLALRSASDPSAVPVIPTPEALVHELANRGSSPAPIAPIRPRFNDGAGVHAHRLDTERRGALRKTEIDLERLKLQGFVTPDAPQSMMAQEFRVLK